MNIIPISQKSAKIAIFSCQKNRVPNKIETWINQNSVVTGIWTDPENVKSLAVLFSEQSLVEKRYFSKIAVLYIERAIYIGTRESFCDQFWRPYIEKTVIDRE